MRLDKPGRRHVERAGAGDKARLVRRQERERCCKQVGIRRASPQPGNVEPGQIEQPRPEFRIPRNIGERTEGQRLGLLPRGSRLCCCSATSSLTAGALVFWSLLMRTLKLGRRVQCLPLWFSLTRRARPVRQRRRGAVDFRSRRIRVWNQGAVSNRPFAAFQGMDDTTHRLDRLRLGSGSPDGAARCPGRGVGGGDGVGHFQAPPRETRSRQ